MSAFNSSSHDSRKNWGSRFTCGTFAILDLAGGSVVSSSILLFFYSLWLSFRMIVAISDVMQNYLFSLNV